MADHVLAAETIAEEVRKRLPSIEELVAIPDPADMGPDITIPAVWMSLLLVHMLGLKTLVEIREEAVGALLRCPLPTTADQMGNYAGALAEHAAETFGGDRVEGSSVLFQGGIASLMSVLPPKEVMKAVQNLAELFDLREKLGIAEVRQ